MGRAVVWVMNDCAMSKVIEDKVTDSASKV
jgi:hypothetical protein